jgi:hypothetical protein
MPENDIIINGINEEFNLEGIELDTLATIKASMG